MIEAVFALAIWGWFLAGIGLYVGIFMPKEWEHESLLISTLKLFLCWLIWPVFLTYRFTKES